jgi:hypothetical protein
VRISVDAGFHLRTISEYLSSGFSRRWRTRIFARRQAETQGFAVDFPGAGRREEAWLRQETVELPLTGPEARRLKMAQIRDLLEAGNSRSSAVYLQSLAVLAHFVIFADPVDRQMSFVDLRDFLTLRRFVSAQRRVYLPYDDFTGPR